MGRVRTSFLACQIKEFLTKKSRCRRGRESLTNIFHLLLKHDDDEQGRGASLTSIKHHYKIVYPLSIFGAEKELDKWKQLMARQSSKKGEYFLTFLWGKSLQSFCDVIVIFSALERGPKKCIYYDYLILSSMIKVILDGAKRGLLFPTSNILPFSQAWKMYLSQRRHFSRINPQ